MNNDQWTILSLWLNRVGIALDFLAGFLLAPELLGESRLQRFEAYIDEKLFYAYRKINRQNVLLKAGIKSFFSNPKELKEQIISLTLMVLTAGMILVDTVYIPLLPRVEIEYETEYQGPLPKFIGQMFLDQINTEIQVKQDPVSRMYFITVLMILEILLLLSPAINVIVLSGLLYIIRKLLKLFKGDNQVRSVFIKLGIICFSLGTISQLVATFN